MKKILIILPLAAILVFIGYQIASFRNSVAAMDEHFFRVSDVPSAELKFLKTLNSSTLIPPNLQSGTYVLEIQMPSGKVSSKTLEIPFEDNQFAFKPTDNPARVGMEWTAVIEGNAVSWHSEGYGYDSGVEYVGVVSGRQMFGRVYNYVQTPEGEVGFWRIYPQPPALAE